MSSQDRRVLHNFLPGSQCGELPGALLQGHSSEGSIMNSPQNVHITLMISIFFFQFGGTTPREEGCISNWQASQYLKNKDVTTMAVHKNFKEKEKWAAIVRKRQPLNQLAKKLRLKLPNGPNLSVNIQVDNCNNYIRNTLYLQFTI